MELTTKIIKIKDWPESRSVWIKVDGKKVWCAFYWEHEGVRKEEDLCQSIKGLEEDQEVEFSLWKSEKGKYYINSVIPVEQVDGEPKEVIDEDPGPTEFPAGAEKEASKLAETAHPSVRYDNMLIIRQCVIKAVGPIVNGMFIAGANPTAEDAVTIARVLETYVLTGK